MGLFSSQKKTEVYLDNAAATPVDYRVLQAMMPYFSDSYGNPSALHTQAQASKAAIDGARKSIARQLNTQADTIIFTSGGTESDNMALFGVARAHKKGHIVTTKVEHHGVLHACEQLEKEGFDVSYLDVNEQGLVDLKELKQALRKDTILISIMYANNEVGSVQPIADIGRAVLQWRKKNKTAFPYFHTDACQASGFLDVNVEKLHVDLLTLNGSKMYGPKGVGLLYVRRGIELAPLLFGGGQEMHKRSGTENVPGIVGLAKALELVQESQGHINELRNYLWEGIQKHIADVELHGPQPGAARLENNLSVSFLGADAEALVLYLNAKGIFVGTGAACTTGEDDGSHVLKAMGKNVDSIRSSLRFTLGKQNSKKDIDYVLKELVPIVEMVREMGRV